MKLSERLRGLRHQADLPSKPIPFEEFAPDLPTFSGADSVAKNVIPGPLSYYPFPNLVAQSSNALNGVALGAISAKSLSGATLGSYFTYAGSSTKLYELTDLAWTDESKALDYSTATGDVWEFSEFRGEIIATNWTDPVQSMVIGGGATTLFGDLITSTLTPKAKHVGVIRDFLVLGYTNDATDGDQPSRVWWSAIRDGTDFDPDAATQCDYQDQATGGEVTKIVGGVEYGVVFQEKQISRMAYVGSPLVFDFFPADRKRGTNLPQSVIGFGRLSFYITEEGFFVFDGSQSTPIGVNKVDRTFWNTFDSSNRHRMSAAIDPVNKLVIWAFPSTSSPEGDPDTLYVYNFVEQEFSTVEIDTDMIFSSVEQGFTLEGLDTISTNIDLLSDSLDSSVWKGGEFRLAAIDTDEKYATFTGANLDATLVTGDHQLAPGARSLTRTIRPMVNLTPGLASPTITVKIGHRDRLQDDVTFTAASTVNSTGDATIRKNARYHRFQTDISGDWDHAQGVNVSFNRVGSR